jgi:hypothetical protein
LIGHKLLRYFIPLPDPLPSRGEGKIKVAKRSLADYWVGAWEPV